MKNYQNIRSELHTPDKLGYDMESLTISALKYILWQHGVEWTKNAIEKLSEDK